MGCVPSHCYPSSLHPPNALALTLNSWPWAPFCGLRTPKLFVLSSSCYIQSTNTGQEGRGLTHATQYLAGFTDFESRQPVLRGWSQTYLVRHNYTVFQTSTLYTSLEITHFIVVCEVIISPFSSFPLFLSSECICGEHKWPEFLVSMELLEELRLTSPSDHR